MRRTWMYQNRLRQEGAQACSQDGLALLLQSRPVPRQLSIMQKNNIHADRENAMTHRVFTVRQDQGAFALSRACCTCLPGIRLVLCPGHPGLSPGVGMDAEPRALTAGVAAGRKLTRFAGTVSTHKSSFAKGSREALAGSGVSPEIQLLPAPSLRRGEGVVGPEKSVNQRPFLHN